MKRQTYDVAFKLKLASEYEAGNETYMTPANKYNLPRSIVIGWIRKARRYALLLLNTSNPQSGFLNITPRLQEIQPPSHQDEITLLINGFEIKADLQTVARLLSGAKHV